MRSVTHPVLQEPRLLREGLSSLLRKFFLSLSGALRRKTPLLPLRCREMWGMIALELRGVRTSYLPIWSLPPGLFRLSFKTLISRRWKPCALRRLWLYHSKESSLYVRAPSIICLVIVLMLSINSILFLSRRLLK